MDAGAVCLDLAGVDACSDLESERADGLDDPLGASDSCGRTVEGREHPVSGRVDLPAAVAHDRSFRDAIVFAQSLTPRGVPESGEMFRRSNNVCEEHGRETTIAPLVGARSAREKVLNFGRQRLDVAEPRDPVVAIEFDEPGTADPRGDIAARFDPLYLVAFAMQHEGRRLDHRQHLPNICVLRVAHYRLRGGRTGGEPRVGDPVFELGRVVEHRGPHPASVADDPRAAAPSLANARQPFRPSRFRPPPRVVLLGRLRRG